MKWEVVPKIDGSWEVGFKYRWEMLLVGDGLSKSAGGWPPNQVGDGMLAPNRWEIYVLHQRDIIRLADLSVDPL